MDDEPGIADVVSLGFELRWPNAKLLVADSGESGLSMLASERPDLVILDIGLPGKDGFEVLGIIRSVSEVPVIMLTVRGEEAAIVSALEMGAADYVVKPFNPLVLMARAQSVLRRTLIGAETPVKVDRESAKA